MPASLHWNGKSEAISLSQNTVFSGTITSINNPLVNFSTNSLNQNHCVFIGDNFSALAALNDDNIKFNFIYIDPPYNTGQRFCFDDKQTSNNANYDSTDLWLSMMYPRLSLAQKVLSEDGAIFISIDERELPSLTLILQEIFEKPNFIGILKWKKKRKPSFLDKHIGTTIEYIIIYAKNRNVLKKLIGNPTEEKTRPVLNATNTISVRTLKKATKSFCKDGFYCKGSRLNKTLSINFLEDWEVKSGELVNDVAVSGKFRVDQNTLDNTVFITKKCGLRRLVLESEKTHKHATDDCTNNWPTNEDAETELKSIFGKKIFDYPKPTELICRLIKMCQFTTDNIKCLDFFAGSGTLGEAVLKLNKEDNINRTFCLIQSEETISNTSKNYDFSFPAISDILIHRIKSCEAKYTDKKTVQFFKVVEP